MRIVCDDCYRMGYGACVYMICSPPLPPVPHTLLSSLLVRIASSVSAVRVLWCVDPPRRSTFAYMHGDEYQTC